MSHSTYVNELAADESVRQSFSDLTDILSIISAKEDAEDFAGFQQDQITGYNVAIQLVRAMEDVGVPGDVAGQAVATVCRYAKIGEMVGLNDLCGYAEDYYWRIQDTGFFTRTVEENELRQKFLDRVAELQVLRSGLALSTYENEDLPF